MHRKGRIILLGIFGSWIVLRLFLLVFAVVSAYWYCGGWPGVLRVFKDMFEYSFEHRHEYGLASLLMKFFVWFLNGIGGIFLLLLMAVLSHVGVRTALIVTCGLYCYAFSPIKIVMWCFVAGNAISAGMFAFACFHLVTAAVLMFSGSVREFQKHQRERRKLSAGGMPALENAEPAQPILPRDP